MEEEVKTSRVVSSLREIFGLSERLAFTLIFSVVLLLAGAVVWFIEAAPPHTLIITTGVTGSTFQTNAERYSTVLERNGIRLKILPSEGSEENLRRLNNPKFRVDVGFVQGGVTNDPSTNKLVSLGSVTYAPLMVFYRATNNLTLLSDFAGKRVAIGPKGSGTRSLALTLLALNGITNGGSTTLSDADGGEAAKALLDGTVDAVFMMGDSASPPILRQLLLTPGIRIFDFTQADGYTRRVGYLNKLVLPKGSIDFGKNIPAQDVNLVGPTVEILARASLHPALSDLLLGAVKEVNGPPGLFRRRAEFPSSTEHDFPISADATRYYTSGKSFFYKWLPFWLATRVKVLLVFVPLLIVMLPAFKLVPFLLRLRMNLLIYRWYRELLTFEKELGDNLNPAKRKELGRDIDVIEQQVNRLKVPPSFADQFYDLRGHIQIVRSRLNGSTQTSLTDPAKN
jgi:TRAP transporter TAXI family solute receptor